MIRTFPVACELPVRQGRSALRPYAILLVVALFSWWDLAYRQGGLPVSGAGRTGPHLDPAVAATILVLARIAVSAVEALAYSLWWRTRGARLPFGPFLVALLALSLLDRCAISLATLAERTPALAPWLAPVAGLHLLAARQPMGESGLASASGSLGLLALARITMTARVQATALSRGLGGPLLVTGAIWLVTRVALWWTMDLVRGMSPVR
jgi:hypothetical protein